MLQGNSRSDLRKPLFFQFYYEKPFRLGSLQGFFCWSYQFDLQEHTRYSLALALVAIGILGFAITHAVGDLISWAGAISNYLGCLLFLQAIMSSKRGIPTSGRREDGNQQQLGLQIVSMVGNPCDRAPKGHLPILDEHDWSNPGLSVSDYRLTTGRMYSC